MEERCNGSSLGFVARMRESHLGWKDGDLMLWHHFHRLSGNNIDVCHRDFAKRKHIERFCSTVGIGYYDYHLMTIIGNNDYFPDSRFKMPFYYIRNVAQ